VWFFKQVRGRIRYLALAVGILAYSLPLSADPLAVAYAFAPDGLFDPSLVAASVSASGEFPSIGADLLLRAEEPRDLLAFVAFASEADTLHGLADRQDDRSESGAGVRRFILLTILFGAILRFLTSPAFYAWAADVFDPLDGY